MNVMMHDISNFVSTIDIWMNSKQVWDDDTCKLWIGSVNRKLPQ